MGMSQRLSMGDSIPLHAAGRLAEAEQSRNAGPGGGIVAPGQLQNLVEQCPAGIRMDQMVRQDADRLAVACEATLDFAAEQRIDPGARQRAARRPVDDVNVRVDLLRVVRPLRAERRESDQPYAAARRLGIRSDPVPWWD